MDFTSILLSLALTALVGAFVARPLLVRAAPARRAHAAEETAADYEAVLIALRDLDADHATGKIAAEDYEPQRAALTAQGVALLKKLDAAPAPVTDDDEIEAAVRARRAPAAPAGAAGFCHKCGAARQSADRFCAKCGAAFSPLTETA